MADPRLAMPEDTRKGLCSVRRWKNFTRREAVGNANYVNSAAIRNSSIQ